MRREPRDDAEHFIITGPTVAGAFAWAMLAGLISLAIVVVIGVTTTALHRKHACIYNDFTSSPAETGPAAMLTSDSAASGSCSAGDPMLRGARE